MNSFLCSSYHSAAKPDKWAPTTISLLIPKILFVSKAQLIISNHSIGSWLLPTKVRIFTNQFLYRAPEYTLKHLPWPEKVDYSIHYCYPFSYCSSNSVYYFNKIIIFIIGSVDLK